MFYLNQPTTMIQKNNITLLEPASTAQKAQSTAWRTELSWDEAWQVRSGVYIWEESSLWEKKTVQLGTFILLKKKKCLKALVARKPEEKSLIKIRINVTVQFVISSSQRKRGECKVSDLLHTCAMRMLLEYYRLITVWRYTIETSQVFPKPSLAAITQMH